MKIEVLGTGCYKCIMLEISINEVLHELGMTGVDIMLAGDEKAIRKYMPLDELPGLVIDGHLVSSREVPDRETLYKWLRGTHEPII